MSCSETLRLWYSRNAVESPRGMNYRIRMRGKISLAVVTLILLNAGCASIGVRTGAYQNRCLIFPATANDIGTVCHAVSMPFRSLNDVTQMNDPQDGIVYMFAPVAICDLPLAVIVDTLFLPRDIFLWRNPRRIPDPVFDRSSPESDLNEHSPVSEDLSMFDFNETSR